MADKEGRLDSLRRAAEAPGDLERGVTAPVVSVTTQILPPGASAASSREPKLGAAETSDSALSLPPPADVAMAILSPSGPFSEATFGCIHTRVTTFDLLTNTRSPAAPDAPMASGAEAMVRIPPAQALAPRGSVHRLTFLPDPLSPIQPM